MFKIPPEIEYVINTLNSADHEAYIVGGCVRDILLNKPPHDFDVTTSATPEEVISLFPKTVPTGIKHGTVTVLAENEPVEVTTFRTEGSYTDCRRPDSVKFVSNLSEDLSRRDFTVNAMAYNPKCGLQDFFGGENDLKNKILRAVGEPEKRFTEDALRILRLFRFASTLGFEIEDKTLTAALKCAEMLSNISRERIAAELKKAVTGDDFFRFAPLISAGGLEFLNITRLPDFDTVKRLNKNPMLCYFAFLYGAGDDSLKELRPSNKEKDYFAKMQYLLSCDAPETKADVKEMLNLSSPEILSDYFDFTDADKTLLLKVLGSGEPYRISDLKLNGDDLLKMGFKGTRIKERLELLRRFVVDNPDKNNKDDLTAQIKVTK